MLPQLPVVPDPGSAPPLEDWCLTLAEQLSRCSRQLRHLIARHCADLGLSEAQVALLQACRRSPSSGSSQKELAERLLVSPALISGLVEELRQAGLLVGRRDVHDRRRQQWQLTPAGQGRLHAVLERVAGWASTSDLPLDLGDLLWRLEQLAAALAGRSNVPADSPWSGVGPGEQRGAA